MTVFNVIQDELSIRKLMNYPAGCVVVLVFDTDKEITEHLKKNLELLRSLPFKVEVMTVVEVLNFEDELERTTDIKRAQDFTNSESLTEFKSAVNKMKDEVFRAALKRHKFDLNKLWIRKPPRKFSFVKQDAEVFHVGGTSIQGMISKPIIDILVCPHKRIPPDECIPDLERIGYTSLGECGRPGRYFFSKGDQPGKTFYLHLCYEEHKVAQDQLLLQRIEQENSDVCRQYTTMKLMLRAVFPDNRNMYRQLKGLFIEGVLAAWRGKTR